MERGGSEPSTIGFKTLTLLQPSSQSSLRAPTTPFPSTTLRRRPKAASAQLQQRNQRLERSGDLVRPIAWHYAHRCPETAEDLQQVGLLGLLRAAELYQETLGTPFPAFARPHIRGAILHYLRDQARPVRLPRRVQELEDRLRAVRRELEASLGRLATATELRQALGLNESQWQGFEAAQRISRPCSLSDLEDQAMEDLPVEEPVEEIFAGGQVLQALRGLDPLRGCDER